MRFTIRFRGRLSYMIFIAALRFAGAKDLGVHKSWRLFGNRPLEQTITLTDRGFLASRELTDLDLSQ